jgi:hypothetical protein
MAKYDDMSFGKAFAAARGDLGSGKTFTWKGKTFKTDTADGKKAAPKASAMSSSPKPAARPSWMGTPGGQTRMSTMTTEGKRSDASRVSVNPLAKSTSGGMTSSPRPMPKPAPTGMTSSPRPMPKPSASPKPAAAMPQRPISKTPGAKPAGEGKNLTPASRAMLARTTKGK